MDHHHHCHCPPPDHYHGHHSPPPCEQPPDSSWNTPGHCHPPCPPPDDRQDYPWPPFQPAPFPTPWSSSSSSDPDVQYCTTVRVEEAPPLERKVDGGAAAGPSGTEVLFVLLFWAVVAGLLYWYWYR